MVPGTCGYALAGEGVRLRSLRQFLPLAVVGLLVEQEEHSFGLKTCAAVRVYVLFVVLTGSGVIRMVGVA
jgi:hypothetical protein